MNIEKDIKRLFREVESHIGFDLCKKYEKGIKANLKIYITDWIENNSEEEYKNITSDDFTCEDFVKEYMEKESVDFSPKDVAEMVLRHFGLPPIDTMSIESLEKTIQSLFETLYKDHVYLKKVQGGKISKCVRRDVAFLIQSGDNVSRLVNKQAAKAEGKITDPVTLRQYRFERSLIEYLDGEGESPSRKELPQLTCSDRLYLMVEAVFNLFLQSLISHLYRAI